MKKIVILIIFIAFPLLAVAQLTGNGTYTNPWSGTLAGDATWDGTKYINGDITVDNEKLTISPGTIIIFLSESADLIITGTGQLESDGTAENMIRFTADDDNDGIYGEAGENWGHVSFQIMGSAGASLIDYCLIEYGDVRTAGSVDNPFKYGGAIHAAFSDLTISNCILRRNKAKWGGGLFVNKNFSPKIENCTFLNNSSDRAGGGAYFWDGSSSLILNCLFEGNACLETLSNNYSGGGICGQSGTSIKVVNCTFINNTTTRPDGAGIELYSSNNARVINNIFWGSSNQVFLSGTNGNTFINSAIQASIPTGSINCITLSSINSDPTGPNFKTTDGSDWSIKFISPCRDAGTDSYDTPNIVPTTDYLGNSRTMTTDIGAYEVQYSRWKTTAGTTDWNTGDNWDGGVPASTRDVIVPTGSSLYPTTSPGPDFTIGADKELIIEPGARVTLGNLTNNGIIKLNHNSSEFASLVINSYTRGSGGSEEIQLYLTGGGTQGPPADYKWHYFSSPVSSLSTDLFSALTIDLAQFVESRPSISLTQGWVAYDGYVYSTGLTNGPTFSSLTPGKGYNFWDDTNNTITFGGLFNTSDAVMSLGYSGLPTMHGFNLLGNPFSSGLNWEDIIDGVYFPYPANTSKGLYFTRNNEQCTYAAGVGVPGDVTGIIPPMQGFFVKTYNTDNSINLPAAARTHENIHPRYKGESIIPLVRLAIFEDAVSNDETVVRFDAEAKSNLDNDFDALKMFLSSTKTTIHTALGGTDYAINGQPFPESILEIPVVVNVISTGTHKISATQLQGLDSYSVSVTDKTTGFTADLKTTPVVTFSASPGLLNDRFTIKFSNISTGNEDLYTNNNSFNIYRNFNYINIQTVADEWDGKTGSVKVLDMSGKTVSDLRRTEFSKTSVTQIEAPDANGLYFIEIKSGVNRFVGKVVIK